MKKFKVVGKDRMTGTPQTVELEALTRVEAMVEAGKMGLKVATIEELRGGPVKNVGRTGGAWNAGVPAARSPVAMPVGESGGGGGGGGGRFEFRPSLGQRLKLGAVVDWVKRKPLLAGVVGLVWILLVVIILIPKAKAPVKAAMPDAVGGGAVTKPVNKAATQALGGGGVAAPVAVIPSVVAAGAVGGVVPGVVSEAREESSKLTPSDLFAACSPSVGQVMVKIKGGEALGSGFVVSGDGLMVTNLHVIADALAMQVNLPGRNLFTKVTVVAEDRVNDLAILKVEGSGLPVLKLAGDLPTVGAKIYAIGNPEGLTNTFSDGMVSAVRTDTTSGSKNLQITAAISHGSSGGPVLDETGKVVGVSTFMIDGGQSLNFAIPSTLVVELMKKAGVGG